MHFDSKLEYNHCTDILNYGSGITQSRTESLKTDKHTINKKTKKGNRVYNRICNKQTI